MAGKLPKNLRSGNLAEHLGIFLLKGIAGVAEVPRQEDLGVDAICNLLRLGTDGNFYAEDGFFVQLKSLSVRSLAYNDHEIEWVTQQKLPMFVGSVDRKEPSIELYSTLYMNQVALSEIKKSTLRLEPPPGGGVLPQALTYEHEHATAWVGPPVVRWTEADTHDAKKMEQIYNVLKQFFVWSAGSMHCLSYASTRILFGTPTTSRR